LFISFLIFLLLPLLAILLSTSAAAENKRGTEAEKLCVCVEIYYRFPFL
jgi:hypothetical protein